MTYIPPGAGDAVWIGAFGVIYKMPPEATPSAIAVVEHVLGPQQLGAPLHRHSREDEIVKPRGVFHTFWNAGRTPVRFLEVIAPGVFAQYFRELAPLLSRPGPPDFSGIAALGGRYGVEFNFASVPELLEQHSLRLG